MATQTIKQFFNDIEDKFQQRRNEIDHVIRNFLTELTPRIHVAEKLDDEMNRVFAHRFNVLDYARTDEIGLSRVIASLLDPSASHGQGKLFLQIFLDLLREDKNCKVNSDWLQFENIKVHREKTIESGRKIDIYLTINNHYYIAIENKPYAADIENQVIDYLNHLKKNYKKDNFLLIYLSSLGQKPSEISLPRGKYQEWEGQFKIMAYHNNPSIDRLNENEAESEDENNNAFFQTPFSLMEWFKKCRKNCEAERLRSFLHDAENFCSNRFGGNDMSSSVEQKAVQDLILSDPEKFLPVAQIVYEAWETIRNDICEEFDALLISNIKSSIPNACEIIPREGSKKAIKIRGKNWESKMGDITISLEPESKYSNYFVGVSVGNTNDIDEQQH